MHKFSIIGSLHLRNQTIRLGEKKSQNNIIFWLFSQAQDSSFPFPSISRGYTKVCQDVELFGTIQVSR